MSRYYDYFDKLTDDGYVFTKDRSSDEAPQRSLTKEEKKERTEWNKTLRKLRNHYEKVDDDDTGPRRKQPKI